MTTIKIGNQEVELEAAKEALAKETYIWPRSFYEALSTAIKEAEEVDGPFGIDEGDIFTFRGEVVTDAGGVALYGNFVLTPILNRILSQHFVSKDELRKVLAAGAGIAHLDYYSQINRLRESLSALIEKGAPDA